MSAQYFTKYLNCVKRDDFVAIPAATSSVGLAAMQIVKDLGGKTIGVTRNESKSDFLRSNKSDFVVTAYDYNYLQQVMDVTGGKGVNVTFDPVGGKFLGLAAKAAASP